MRLVEFLNSNWRSEAKAGLNSYLQLDILKQISSDFDDTVQDLENRMDLKVDGETN